MTYMYLCIFLEYLIIFIPVFNLTACKKGNKSRKKKEKAIEKKVIWIIDEIFSKSLVSKEARKVKMNKERI